MENGTTDILDALGGREEKEVKKRTRAKKDKPTEKVVKPKKIPKKELEIQALANETLLPDNYYVVWTEAELKAMCEHLTPLTYIAVDTETTSLEFMTATIVGFSIYANGLGFYVPMSHSKDIKNNPEEYTKYIESKDTAVVGVDYVDCLSKRLVVEYIKPILEDPNKKFILHNAKYDMHIMYNQLGISIDPYYDTMIGAKLLDENQSAALKDLATLYLKTPSDTYSKIFGKVTFDLVQCTLLRGVGGEITRFGNLAAYYAIKDTVLTLKLYEFQINFLNKPEMKDLLSLLFDIEMPFLKIMWVAENKGIKFDSKYMNEVVAPVIKQDIADLHQQLTSILGDINFKSPAQVSHVIYNVLKLPVVNRDKDKQFSTDKATLNKLKQHHVVAKLLLEYRAKTKLYDAFVVKLPKEVLNGRIHPSFHTYGAVTGRPSCSRPNLLQIPSGPLIRNAFIADEHRLLSSHDYGSQELRILAHISKDPVLIDIYLNGKDVHSMTGSYIYSLTHPEDVTEYDEFQYCRSIVELFCDKGGDLVEDNFNGHLIEDLHAKGLINSKDEAKLRADIAKGKACEKCRKKAKSVNFGIVYGIGAKGLADQLEIPEKEAQLYIDGFLGKYVGVAKWMKDTEKEINKTQFITDMLGRKRRLYNEMNSGEKWRMASAYRMGTNFQIQGTAASMSKKATVDLQPLLKELGATILLFIYDELIIDVPENIGSENLTRIAQVMIDAIPLNVGMTSDNEIGTKWNDKMNASEIEELRLLHEED